MASDGVKLQPVFHPPSLEELKTLESDGAFVGLLTELIQMFLSDTPHQLDQMLMAAQAGHLPQVQRIAHRLKSGAVQLGALRFAVACRELEGESELDEVKLKSWVKKLQEEFDQVQVELQKELRKLSHRES